MKHRKSCVGQKELDFDTLAARRERYGDEVLGMCPMRSMDLSVLATSHENRERISLLLHTIAQSFVPGVSFEKRDSAVLLLNNMNNLTDLELACGLKAMHLKPDDSFHKKNIKRFFRYAKSVERREELKDRKKLETSMPPFHDDQKQ